jgi:apolipoprotein N-acyltransferase
MRPFIWLVAGALLLGIGIRTSAIALGAVWLALTFLVRAVRTTPPSHGLPSAGLALYAALAFGNRGILPVDDPLYFVVVVVMAAVALAPFAVDRLVEPRIAGPLSTLVFPLAWVAEEFLRSRLPGSGTWGSIAYSQYGNLPLAQLAACTGIWGITFLIAWFASTANWAWARGFAWSGVRGPLSTYAAVLSAISILGVARLVREPRPTNTIRAAVVSLQRDLLTPAEMARIADGRINIADGGPVAEKLARLHEWFFENTEREARAGARLVAWPEMSFLVLADDEAAALERARRLAAREHIYLAMGLGTVRPGVPKPFENKTALIDPSGRMAYSYLKSRPVPGWEERVMRRGDGHLPVATTELGRMATSICFEADFPEFVRPIGSARADLWILPANDWAAIKRTHFEMAAFRAIENGTPILRAASSGISGVFDPLGRVLGLTDHFSGPPTMVSEVPVGGVATVYARTGDLFAWLCVAGCVAAGLVALTAGRSRSLHPLDGSRPGITNPLEGDRGGGIITAGLRSVSKGGRA